MNTILSAIVPHDHARESRGLEAALRQIDPQELSHPELGVPLTCHEGFLGLDEGQCALRAEILHRAYSIWVSRGRMADVALGNWLEAEAEVRSEHGPLR